MYKVSLKTEKVDLNIVDMVFTFMVVLTIKVNIEN